MVGQLSVVFAVHSTLSTPKCCGWVLHLGVISPSQSIASSGGDNTGMKGDSHPPMGFGCCLEVEG